MCSESGRIFRNASEYNIWFCWDVSIMGNVSEAFVFAVLLVLLGLIGYLIMDLLDRFVSRYFRRRGGKR